MTTPRNAVRERRPLGANFTRLFVAATLSSTGDGVTFVAAPLLAASLTHDPRLVAGIETAVAAPWLLLSLPAGALVDRWDRRRVMWTVDAMRTVVVAAIALAAATHTATLPLLYVAFFVLGCGQVFFDNADQAMLPTILDGDDLERANARLQAGTLGAGQLLGPALGSLLFAAAVALPFGFDAATFAVSALLITRLRGTFVARRTSPEGSENAPPRLRSDIAEGLRWLVGHRLLRTLALVLGAMNLLDLMARSTFVLFAQQRLGLGALGFGLVMTMFAIGGVVGGIATDRWSGRLPDRVLAVVVAVMGLGYVVVPLTENAAVTAVAFLGAGAASVVWNVVTVSARQQIIPAPLFARVNSVYRLLAWGSMPVGAALGGVVAHRFGLGAPFWVAAVGHVGLVLVAAHSLRRRDIDAARGAAAVSPQ